MAKFITAIFENRVQTQDAVTRLMGAGIARDDISVLMSDGTRGRDFGMEEATKAPEGATTGAVAGGALGAIAAGLVAVGAVAAPGIGLVAAGPILAAFAGAGAGGAAGGLAGALVGAGIPEHEAKLNADRLERGDILVGVQVPDDRAELVENVFDTTAGTDRKTASA